MKKKKKKSGSSARMQWIAFFFASSVLLLAVRAFQLHVLWNLQARVVDQQNEKVVLHSKRGTILDRNGQELAVSVEMESIALRPQHVPDAGAVVARLSEALDLQPKEIRTKLASQSPFVWVKRFASPREVDEVRAARLKGVEILQGESRRFYPQGSLGSAVIGVAGVDSQGLEGIELSYDKLIRSKSVTRNVPRDAMRRLILTEGMDKVKVPEGSRVYLTIDVGLQRVLERELGRTVRETKAKGGMAIAVDPQTGAIMAMANAPKCNLNVVSDCTPDQLRNRAVADTFEPGSIFKMVLAAAALEENVAQLGDTYYCEEGEYAFAGKIIHDTHRYGLLPFEAIIQRSSNIGVTKIAEKLGASRYYEHIERFGFGQKTGVELPGEVSGLVRHFRRWRPIDLATHAFGQGISVTGLQMVMAYAAVANGGLLMKPYLVDRVVDPSGHTVRSKPSLVRRVVSEETARTLTSILELVVEEGGTGTRARLEGFRVAGKTGTAQKVNPVTRSYVGGKRIASFAGFVPSDSPKLAVLVVIDEPVTNVYGGVVAAPSFRNIAHDSLMLLDVPGEIPSRDFADRPQESQQARAYEDKKDGLPSVLGLSLRDAMVKMRELGIDFHNIEFRGSGYVIGQSWKQKDGGSFPRKVVLTLAPVARIP